MGCVTDSKHTWTCIVLNRMLLYVFWWFQPFLTQCVDSEVKFAGRLRLLSFIYCHVWQRKCEIRNKKILDNGEWERKWVFALCISDKDKLRGKEIGVKIKCVTIDVKKERERKRFRERHR